MDEAKPSGRQLPLQKEGKWRLIVLLSIISVTVFRGRGLAQTFSANRQRLGASNIIVGAIGVTELFRASCECPVAGQEVIGNVTGSIWTNQFELARAEYYSGKYEEATRILETLPVSDGRSPLINYLEGASYVCIDEPGKAAEHWTSQSIAWQAFWSVYTCRQSKNVRRRETFYRIALSSAPEIWDGWSGNPAPTIWNYLAASELARLNGSDTAEYHWLHIAADLFPDNALAWYSLGDYHRRKGEVGSAESYFRRSLQSASPTQLASLYPHYIRAALELEHWRKAAAAIESWLLIDGDGRAKRWNQAVWLVERTRAPELCTSLKPSLISARPNDSSEVRASKNRLRRVCHWP